MSDPTIAVAQVLKVLASEEVPSSEPWDIFVLGDELIMSDVSLFSDVMKTPWGPDAAGLKAVGPSIRLLVVQFPVFGSRTEPSTGSAFSQYASVLAARFGGQYFRIIE